jgi:hypothetical protein
MFVDAPVLPPPPPPPPPPVKNIRRTFAPGGITYEPEESNSLKVSAIDVKLGENPLNP